ncbi:putative MFS-type transporter EfpA (plasmid) [Streptomyces lavendulae subsp. lavendulae]|uniref:Major facilitator superfamily transporter n=2 Tax=Streptomycetaceae TaxID=2062 RepID=Q56H96_KITAU|nr:MFS transporter [Streptomyces lavendulae]AAX57197.2 major facilitator superfamily transporter [Streptomyces lavendulae subsp. lavendulae]ATZ29805.1 putative MFS-type transporter EfpA [Streptomyces lavendulae subsp. lavendulae]
MYPSTTNPPVGERTRWALVAVLAANMLVDALEVSATLVAMPAVGADLGAGAAGLQWLVSGFAAGFGGLLLLGGRLVEGLGRRRVFLAALLVFAAASLAGALTDSLAALTATRVLKGFCVALTAPTGLAIITSAVPEGAARRRAVSLYSLFGAAGFCAGLLLSGLFTGAGWRWTLAFPAPVALLLLAAGARLVPRDVRDSGARDAGVRDAGVRGAGVRGAGVRGGGLRGPGRHAAACGAALTGAVLLLVYGLAHLAGPGREPVRAAAAFAGAALLGAVFVTAERRSPRPLVPPVLLRHGPLLRSALGAAALNGSYVGFLLVASLHLRETGRSPWQTALVFLPAAAPLALSALHSARIAVRLGPARAVAAGAVLAPLGYALYPRAPDADPRWTVLLPATACVGAAFALAFTALHLQATGAVPARLQGAAGGLYQTFVQAGAALTAAPVAALYTVGRAPALCLVTVIGAAGACVALGGLVPAARAAAAPPPNHP